MNSNYFNGSIIGNPLVEFLWELTRIDCCQNKQRIVLEPQRMKGKQLQKAAP